MAEEKLVSNCRACHHTGFRQVLDFGRLPPSDALCHSREESLRCDRYPLQLLVCERCGLAQLGHSISEKKLFGAQFPYYSSYSRSYLEHARKLADTILERLNLKQDDWLLEIASNDGYLLRYFKDKGVPVLGIDPASGPASMARSRGIDTLEVFFDRAVADQLLAQRGRAKVVVANNVFAHVGNQHGFLSAVEQLLADDGTLVMEVPYFVDLVDGVRFDTIYHEHQCYFTVTSLLALLAHHELHLNRVDHFPVHGGSLRLWISRQCEPDESIDYFLQKEKNRVECVDAEGLQLFSSRVPQFCQSVAQSIEKLHRQGVDMAAYGAAAKGTMMLNMCGVDHSRIPFAVDRNPHKQGRFMPGVGVEILPIERLRRKPPQLLVLLPWNLEREILAQEQPFIDQGGSFLIPGFPVRLINHPAR
ncbi:MAG: class I SAM-dependent methyltransferase [Magnetococcales bacterium]|nr:class I SAM-dependent methyltransferase [Magnetococcales bacterium]